MTALPTICEVEQIAQALLGWYEGAKRDLPWRQTTDPYRIWVSEVMLQQTRVETVIPYYQRFLTAFPTVAELAGAPEDELLKVWEGLGYYSRARNLQRAAREVVERYAGRIPEDASAIASLPGIGPYTAGAVLSIAYNHSVPAVDGNVCRVLARLFRLSDDVSQPSVRRQFERIVERLIPPGRARDFNQALMELGATTCTPQSPRCDRCPLTSFCVGRAEGLQNALPVKSAKKAPRLVDISAAVLVEDGRILLTRRPNRGLLAGMWQLPSCEVSVEESWETSLATYLDSCLSIRVDVQGPAAEVVHTFTHIKWHLRAFWCRRSAGNTNRYKGLGDHERSGDIGSIRQGEWLWVPLGEVDSHPMAAAYLKVLAAIRESHLFQREGGRQDAGG